MKFYRLYSERPSVLLFLTRIVVVINRVEIRIRVALPHRSITAVSCGVHKTAIVKVAPKKQCWPYSPVRILLQHMRLGCSAIPRTIVSHVKLMYFHAVPISWLFPFDLSWPHYLLFFTFATHNIIESTDEVGKTWPSWTLTVHKSWCQIIPPTRNYTPETKYSRTSTSGHLP